MTLTPIAALSRKGPPGSMASRWWCTSVLALAIAACGPGPTLYLGEAPHLDDESGPSPGAMPIQDAAVAPPEGGAPPDRHDAMSVGDGEFDDDDDDRELDEDDEISDGAGRACVLDGECAVDPSRPYCQLERGRCVACREDHHCAAGEECDAEEGDCDQDDS
jgi:Cys-rich repeat protein